MKLKNLCLVLALVVLLSGCNLFGGKQTPYDVSGTILDVEGNGLADVSLNFSGGQGVAETDEDGKWYKSALKGEVVVTPVKDGWKFEPTSIKVSASSTEVDFEATEAGFFLTINVIGRGEVNSEVVVSSASIEEIERGGQVVLVANPEKASKFSHWEGDLAGTENPVTITMDSSKTITAVFVDDFENVELEDIRNNVWGIEPIGNNIEGTAKLYAATDSDTFYIWAVGTLDNNNNNIFFDIDMNSETGYDGWQWTDMGGDFRLTNNNFFRSTGRGWNFENIGQANYTPFEEEGTLAGFFTAIPKTLFGDVSKMRIGFGGSGGGSFDVIMPHRGGPAAVFTF